MSVQPVDSRLQFRAQLQQQQCDEHEHEHWLAPRTWKIYDRGVYGFRDKSFTLLQGEPYPIASSVKPNEQWRAAEQERSRPRVEFISKDKRAGKVAEKL